MSHFNPTPDTHRVEPRRQWLRQAGMGLGGIALGTLLQRDARASQPGPATTVAAKARSVIFLHMVGAPSQLDLFDDKPTLRKHHGQLLPQELWDGLRLAFIRERPKLFGSPFKFRNYGISGQRMSELVPHLGEVADEITLINSMHTEQINHAPAQLFMQTGFARFGRPCVGSWVSYGLGTENENLPSFVVMNTGTIAGAGNSLWGSGFLPTVHQGIEFRSKGDPVLFLSNPQGIDAARRKRIVDSVNRLNQIQLGRRWRRGDCDTHSAIRNGIPDADLRARVNGSLDRVRGDPSNVRHQARRRELCQQLLVGTSTRGTRREVCATL